MKPDTVAIDIKEEITAFRSIVCEEHFPVIDFEALLAQCFEVFSSYQVYGHLARMAFEMAYGEVLFENAELDDFDRGQIYSASLQFLHRLWLKLVEQDLLADHVLPYAYREMRNDILYLSRFTPG